MSKLGCGKWLREDEDYGWFNCGDVIELKSGKESKPKLCKKCREITALTGTVEK